MHRRAKFTIFRNRKSSSERSETQRTPQSTYGHDSTQHQNNESVPGSSKGQPKRCSHGRHPPDLKGKAIGMYYRELSLQKKREAKWRGEGTEGKMMEEGTEEKMAEESGVKKIECIEEKGKKEHQEGERREEGREGKRKFGGPEQPPVKGPKHRLQITLSPEKEKEIQDLLDKVRSEGRYFEWASQKRRDLPSPTFSPLPVRVKTEHREIKQDPGYSKTSEDDRKMETAELISAFTYPKNELHRTTPKIDSAIWQTVGSRPRKAKHSTLAGEHNEEDKNNQSSNYDQYKNIQDSVFKRNFLLSITESIEEKLDRTMRSQSALQRNPELDQSLIDSLIAKDNSPQYQQMLSFRKRLPSFRLRNEILDLIKKNQVVLVSGETGCGKTTQLSQFIVDDEILQNKGSMCHVICTQPRRISATSVAKRVAEERAEPLGKSVGYHIRLEKRPPAKQGSILFCTTGVLLQFMQSDPALRHVSHLVLDEIHERDTVCDFVLTLLRNVIPKRPDLKVVLMSATLNADQFSTYFNNCPCINIPGFTFPVEEYYLEDVLEMTGFQFPKGRSVRESKWRKFTSKGKEALRKEQVFEEMIEPYVRSLDRSKYSKTTVEGLLNPDSENLNCDLLADLIAYICTNLPDGAILVFLPGWTDISCLNRILFSRPMFQSSRFLVIPLHSMMPTTVQRSVFDRPPSGVRKIILATNIAESSITIDDVVYVIDSGKIKMKQYDVESNIQTLLPEWVSVANARQRRGRAGRVQDGVCYHLYTRAREMTLDSYPLPEMLRTRLDQVILMAKIHQVGPVKSFLSRVMNPPDPRAVDIAIKLLYTMNALDTTENLTPLGYHLAQLPLDPQTGKMILMAALFSCVDPVFSVAASLSFKDAFVIPLGKEKLADERKLMLADNSKSDHILLADIIRRWEVAVRRGQGPTFCWENFLSFNTLNLLKDMKAQFGRYLCEMNFLSSSDPKADASNVNSNNRSLVKAIICAGLYPNVAFVNSTKWTKRRGALHSLSTPEDARVQIHPRSINIATTKFDSPFLVYHLKLKSSAVYLHDTTMVYPLPLLFFGENLQYYIENGVEMVSVNDYICFRCKEETADLIMELRHHWNRVLEHKISHPDTVQWGDQNSRECAVFRAIAELVAYENTQRMTGDCSDNASDEDIV